MVIFTGTTPDANLISLGFGAVTCVAGFAGVALGAYSAGILRSRYSNCEPLVSAVGVLVSAPMVYITLVVVEGSPMAIWPFVLIGEITLFLNWALVPKILIDCVVPQRRALASGEFSCNLIKMIFLLIPNTAFLPLDTFLFSLSIIILRNRGALDMKISVRSDCRTGLINAGYRPDRTLSSTTSDDRLLLELDKKYN